MCAHGVELVGEVRHALEAAGGRLVHLDLRAVVQADV
eukprot:COSAG04_NODE_16148_length_508_cov_1.493888_1_plen_36_part_10